MRGYPIIFFTAVAESPAKRAHKKAARGKGRILKSTRKSLIVFEIIPIRPADRAILTELLNIREKP